MLPNHPPLRVVEAFNVLEALFPGRIDLGIGRAPGTDLLTAYALRRTQEALSGDDFPSQLAELLAFTSGEFPEDHPSSRITPTPQGVAPPEHWLLGSSDFSARLAAELGLRFSFAHHINPALAVASLRHYQATFRPSRWNVAPHAMLTVSAICAETDARAEELARSMDLTWLWIEQGRRGPLPSVAEATAYPYTPAERERIQQNRSRHFAGSPQTLREHLGAFCAEVGVTELMVMTMVHDHAARRRSYELLADAFASR
jgi:luciferase family oxidoreductase group 1